MSCVVQQIFHVYKRRHPEIDYYEYQSLPVENGKKIGDKLKFLLWALSIEILRITWYNFRPRIAVRFFPWKNSLLFKQIGLAVGDIESIQKNAELKLLAIEVWKEITL